MIPRIGSLLEVLLNKVSRNVGCLPWTGRQFLKRAERLLKVSNRAKYM